MVDAGRRFFPVPLLQNIMETMGSVKLNVLVKEDPQHC